MLDAVIKVAIRDTVAVVTFVVLLALHTVNGELLRRACPTAPPSPSPSPEVG